MDEQSNTPMSSESTGVAGWFSIWMNAVTKPNEQTFVDIANSPNVKASTAYTWVFIGALVGGFLSLLVQGALISSILGDAGVGNGGFAATAIGVICGAPIGAVVGVIVFAIFAAIVQWIAKMFKGQGTYEQLLYTLAAISVPFALINGVLTLLTAIPFVGACFGIVSLGVSLYALYLNITAVKAVNRFGWGEAAGSVLLPGFVFACCVFVVVFGMTALGVAVGDTFNQINNSMP
jgi:hypothetical protein